MKTRKVIVAVLMLSLLFSIVLPAQTVRASENGTIEEFQVTRQINKLEEVTPELLEWGKYPGLNMDILHKYGFTGKGVTIAYIDQPFDAHEVYDTVNVHYVNNSIATDSMHGPAVLSLLAGKEIGIVPDAEVYYYAHAAWEADQTTHAECLYQIIEQNKSLPDDKKITMVGFSDNIDPREKNVKAFQEAVAECEKNGIMVWFCNEYMMSYFVPFSDKNDYQNLVLDGYHDYYLYVPTSRTTADKEGYSYWEDGGTSWAMPYALGLYGMAAEINPSLSEEQLREYIWNTAYTRDGLKIINPVGFIAEILKTVGRTQVADAMLEEAEERKEYLYVIVNSTLMSEEDIIAVSDYLGKIPEQVLLVDASKFFNAADIYEAMKQDAAIRGGSVIGVQIFGTSSMVPAFDVKYKVQMDGAVDDAGTFVTDLFYGNFDNDSSVLAGYNVMDHFANNWNVTLIPEWPVARLPLSRGEYTNYFKNYFSYTDNKQPTLVNFSNPIFASEYHVDDMTYFLNRMSKEFYLLEEYRLYANEMGDYPIRSTLGGFTAENLAKENEKGVAEFLINTHGQRDNIDKCYFINGKEIRESLVNMQTINNVLDDNVYYLDMWSCLNGYGMENNITTAALSGKCIGMFSATQIISNNGVNCFANLNDMKNSNFYWFYYNYLKALHEGKTRHEAFYTAQVEYGNALLEHSKKGINFRANYQFNLNNLLAYHNFGVMDVTESYLSEYCTSKCRIRKQGTVGITKTYGKVTESIMCLLDREGELPKGYIVYCACCQKLDNGYVRLTVEYKMPKETEVSFVYTTGDGIARQISVEKVPDEGRQVLRMDILEEEWNTITSMEMKYQWNGNVHKARFKF